MPPWRLIIGINLFLCTTVTFMYRTCFTLVLRDMIQVDSDHSKQDHVGVTRYNWSADEQIYLISAYYIGYVITNLFGGFLVVQFGAKRTITFILLTMAWSFALIPIFASLGYVSLFLVRVLQGSIEGPIYPAIQHIIAFWSPPCEKGRFIATFAGSSFGSLIGHGIVGLSVGTLGWPVSFYFSSAVGIVVLFIWMWTVSDRPDLHKRITEKEKMYIETSIEMLVNKDTKEIPLWTIIKSRPVWALIVLNFGASFTNYFQMNSLPTYYNEVLGYSVQQIATIYSISSLIRFCTGLSFSYLGDVLMAGNYCGVTTQRKYFCIFSHIIPGVILISMCFLSRHADFSAGLDVLNTAVMGSINLTVNQNSQDLSPNFASTVFGIVNFTGNLGGFFTLYSLAALNNLNDSIENAWFEMFVLCAVLLFVSAGVFYFFGSGRTQEWNKNSSQNTTTTCDMANINTEQAAMK